MNKLEANISLFMITFYASIQYAFLTAVPESVSDFAFLTITNVIGFLIMLVFFFGELFRVDKKQIVQSFILSLTLFGFNSFLMLGTGSVNPTVCACVLSAYFVLIPIAAFLMYKEKPDKKTFPGIAIVLVGVFFMMNMDIQGLMTPGVLYLLLADAFFTVYILLLGKYSSTSNPSVIAMGQMFFTAIFAFIFWGGECLTGNAVMTLPTDPAFWGSVIYISFFIRGLYGIVQIYALRYVSPLNTSLIFSTEIIMTMFMSPILTLLFGTAPEVITPLRVIGAVFMVIGILAADSTVYNAILRRFKHEKK